MHLPLPKHRHSSVVPNHIRQVSNGLPICHTTHLTGGVFNHTARVSVTGFHATVACAGFHVNNTTASPDNWFRALDKYTATTLRTSASRVPQTCETATPRSLDRRDFRPQHDYIPTDGYHPRRPVRADVTTLYVAAIMLRLQRKYNATTNPAHAAPVPTTCATCHTRQLAAQHSTLFPVDHAMPRRVATSITNREYLVFQCTQCHGREPANFNHPNLSDMFTTV